MPDTTETLRASILTYLATHPRATTAQISEALGRGPHMDELDAMADDGLLTPCNMGGYIGWEIRHG